MPFLLSFILLFSFDALLKVPLKSGSLCNKYDLILVDCVLGLALLYLPFHSIYLARYCGPNYTTQSHHGPTRGPWTT